MVQAVFKLLIFYYSPQVWKWQIVTKLTAYESCCCSCTKAALDVMTETRWPLKSEMFRRLRECSWVAGVWSRSMLTHILGTLKALGSSPSIPILLTEFTSWLYTEKRWLSPVVRCFTGGKPLKVHKIHVLGGRRDGSAGKSTDCSSSSPEFNSQQPDGGSQPSVMGSNGLFQCVWRWLKCTEINKINLKKKKRKEKMLKNHWQLGNPIKITRDYLVLTGLDFCWWGY